MRILMLGWEFPPFISGGLGTACYGLTKALSRQGTQITFVLPKAVGTDYTSHVRLLAPQAASAAAGSREPEAVASTYRYEPEPTQAEPEAFRNVEFRAVPARFNNPYLTTPAWPVGAPAMQATAGGGRGLARPGGSPQRAASPRAVAVTTAPAPQPVRTGFMASGGQGDVGYTGDLIADARRYADLCLDLAKGVEFDLIHAHDWLTFPAGMAIAAHRGRPLVVHVHSTEYDRAGNNIDARIYDIERRGLNAAVRVIAVSHLTRTLLQNRYGVPASKIEIVYNGVENGQAQAVAAEEEGEPAIRSGEKVVLFLGRMTMQKGPEYFVAAAKKVLARFDKVKFIMAGTGDKTPDVIELAAREGIGHKVLFTGFLRGKDVDRVFKMADVYVMPSVSEPFGIAALEAIRHDVPVIMSKQSGVGEVVKHALKVDFWDIDEMANKIIAVLKHPSLSKTLREQADLEVRRLTWDDAASRCRRIYGQAAEFLD